MWRILTAAVYWLLLAAALPLSVGTGFAREEPVATTQAHAGTHPAEDGVPVGGILIVAGVVVGLVFFAWLASRMSDSRPTMP